MSRDTLEYLVDSIDECFTKVVCRVTLTDLVDLIDECVHLAQNLWKTNLMMIRKMKENIHRHAKVLYDNDVESSPLLSFRIEVCSNY